jgi:hypothetical protein
MRRISLLLIALFAIMQNAEAQKFVANYDESKIPEHTLPDPLVTEAGKPVRSADEWIQTRRPEIFELFQKHVYGRGPAPCKITHKLISTKEDAAGGKAIRREVDVMFGESSDSHSMRLLIYTPKTDKPAAAFLGLNFQGNHSIEADPSISLGDRWVRDRKNETVKGNRATEKARGVAASRWPVETIIDRGYGLVTIYYGDIDPDFDDGFKNGIHGAFADQTKEIPAGEKWGSVAAWAYGLSRALDYLEQDDHVDGSRVAVFGHSRLGKTSLWAGASDERFKMVISNNSGCGGAALSRRAIGETIGRINSSFPHWFNDNFTQFNKNENECPVDQHELISLIAPRAVYVASATGDKWADPKGELLAEIHAEPVYRLLGTDGFGVEVTSPEKIAPDQPIKSGTIGYHLRTGGHDVKDFDWQQYLDFADRHLR